MRDDIRPVKITTRPGLENANFKSYHVLIAKAVEMKIPTQKQHEDSECLKEFRANEAWW